MSRPDAGRDGTAEPVSRDQILRRKRGRGTFHFSLLQLTTSRIGNHTLLIYTLLKVLTIDLELLLYTSFARTAVPRKHLCT